MTTSARECIARLSAGGGAGCLAAVAPPVASLLFGGCADGTVAAWRLGALCDAPPPAETRSEWAWDLDVELHR